MPTALTRFFPVLAMLTSGVSIAQGVTITSRSPFLPAAGQEAAPTEMQQPSKIEWCGVMEINGELFFGLSEPEKQRSAWVKQDEAGQSYFVRSYSPAGPTLTIEHQGRNQTLRLKEPKVGALPPGSFPAMPAPMIGNNGVPPSFNGQEGDEAKRLAAVAAEVRRRREQRAAAINPESTPAPQQAQPKQP